jgi:hypothetical protein
MPIPAWFDWTAGVASIAGLGYAWWASHQATGAKIAAQRAEKGVLRRNAEVDFTSLARMAKELHGFVESGMIAEARLRTTDLRAELALAIPNHRDFIGLQFDNLRKKQFDLVLVADGLNRGSDTLTRSERIRLLGITGAILEVLAGQCGELRSSFERGVTNG